MEIGDMVVHFAEGICKYTKMEELTMNGVTRNYCIFIPVDGKTTKLMIPVNLLGKRVRPVMSKKAVQELIEKMPSLRYTWNSDIKARKMQYDDIIIGGDIEKICGLVTTLYEKKSEYETLGKVLSFADQESLNRSRRIIFSEIAYVLGIKYDQVVPLIAQYLEGTGPKVA